MAGRSRLVLIHLLKNDHSGVPLEFDLEFLSGLKAKPTGIGVADQQVAVAMNTGSELGLPTTASA